MNRYHKRVCALLLLLLLLPQGMIDGSGIVSAAGNGADEALARGVERLRAGQYEAALVQFEAATEADPNHRRAWFFHGVALNRLGRFAAADASLARSAALGERSGDLYFELGWAALGRGRYEQALHFLEIAEEEQPGRAQTSEFRGRAHYHRGELDQAEVRFEEALRRDPQLAPTVSIYLAAIEDARGDQSAASQRLQRLIDTYPESEIARDLRRRMVGAPPPAEPGPWRVVLSLGVGYDSNVIALSDQLPLPADITSRSSGFITGSLDLAYDWRISRRDLLTLGYSVNGTLYEGGLSDYHLLDQFGYAQYWRSIDQRFSAGLRISDQFTMLGGRRFRNQVAVQPSIYWRHSERWSTHLAYTFAASDYYITPPIPTLNRDSDAHTIAIAQYIRPGDTELVLRYGYAYTWNDARGADYDYGAHRLFLGATHPLPLGIRGDISYVHVFEDYRNRHSFTGFTDRRDDEMSVLTVYLTRPIRGRASIYARHDYINNRSNIPVFDYDRHITSVGLLWRF
jgi:Tfp pilus assembly protein PilF